MVTAAYFLSVARGGATAVATVFSTPEGEQWPELGVVRGDFVVSGSGLERF